jgi:hypothetical protein
MEKFGAGAEGVKKFKQIILDKALAISRHRGDTEPNAEYPPGLDSTCQNVLYTRTQNALAKAIVRASLEQGDFRKVTTITLKSGCCDQSSCPKRLFVQAILDAISEFVNS